MNTANEKQEVADTKGNRELNACGIWVGRERVHRAVRVLFDAPCRYWGIDTEDCLGRLLCHLSSFRP